MTGYRARQLTTLHAHQTKWLVDERMQNGRQQLGVITRQLVDGCGQCERYIGG